MQAPIRTATSSVWSICSPREVTCGGIDSGALLVLLNHLLLRRGESPQRLEAFTLAVDADAADVRQAIDFLAATPLAYLVMTRCGSLFCL